MELKTRPHYDEKKESAANPSRKRRFSKTLFKQEEFEKTGVAFEWGQTTCLKRAFFKTPGKRRRHGYHDFA